MRATGYSWAGVRTDDFKATVAFFTMLFGQPPTERHDQQEMAKFKLRSGQFFEVLGPADDQHRFITGPVIGFEVQEIERAKVELQEQGVEFLTDIEHGEGGRSWAYFRGPGGHLYELCQPKEEERLPLREEVGGTEG